MSQTIIVVVKQFYNSNIEYLSQEKLRCVAENKALLAYTERSAYMAAAIELNPQELFEKQRMSIIFKIERICKCSIIQRVFNYTGDKYRERWSGSSTAKCSSCGLPFGHSSLVNEQEPVADIDLVEEEATA